MWRTVHPEAVAQLIINSYGFFTHQILIDTIHRSIGTIELRDIIIHKLFKILRRIGCVRNLSPLIKVLLGIIESPGKIEPHVNP